MSNAPPVRRHGRRLAVGFLLLTTGGLIWVGERHRRREAAISRVRELGGGFAEGAPTFPAWTRRPRAALGNRLFTPFATPSDYRVVNLWMKPATDADATRLADIPNLSQLDLNGTRVTDAGLARLAGQTRLDSLELAATDVTDAGLVHLRGMTRLTRLRLERCAITDAGLPHLRAIPSPDLTVHLQGTRVTVLRADELSVAPTDGRLLVRGRYTVTDPAYRPEEVSVDVFGQPEPGTDEASWHGHTSCRPVPRAGAEGVYEFEGRLTDPPTRPGEYRVEAITYATLAGVRGIFTAGERSLTVTDKGLAP